MVTHQAPSPSPAPPATRKVPQALEALVRYRDFRYIWTSGLFSFTAVWMQTLVLAWLTYEVTKSTFLLALFTTARMFPMLLGPLGGVLADRVDRIKLILAAQVIMGATIVALAWLVSMDAIRFWHLFVGGFLLGLGGAPLQPAKASLISDVVRREHLTNAFALNVVAFDVTRVIGPAVGGIMVGALGVGTTLWLSAVLYVLAALSLAPIFRLAKRLPQRGSNSPLQELVAGFRLVLGNKTMLLVLTVTMSCNGLAWSVYQAFMPIFAKDILRSGADGLGYLQASLGIGALLGAVVIAAMGDFRWKGKMYLLGTGSFGLLLGVFALSESFTISLALLFVAGIGTAAFGVMQSALLMALAPPEVRARAMGMQVLFIGVLPIAVLLFGALADVIGVPTTTALAGFALALNMLALYVWSPSVRRL